MKGKTQSKPSKASLVALGLSTNSRVNKKPLHPQRLQKTARETNPGYSLYSTDSEADQAASVHHGLDRCAVLLSNILNNESKVNRQRATVVTDKLHKGSSKKAAKSSHMSVKRAVHRKPKSARNSPLVVPTAGADSKASPPPQRPSPSLLPIRPIHPESAPRYNERLVSSTPVLTSDQRHKQQELKQREVELHYKIEQLKEHYDLLQQQRSPEHQEQQKLQLQQSLLHELDNDQTRRRSPGEADTKTRTGSHSYSNEAQAVLDTGQQLLYSARRPSARRSLDYTNIVPAKDPIESPSARGTSREAPPGNPTASYPSTVPRKGSLGSPTARVTNNVPGKGPQAIPTASYPSNVPRKGSLGSPTARVTNNVPGKGPSASYPSNEPRMDARTDCSDRKHEHAVDDVVAPFTEELVSVSADEDNILSVRGLRRGRTPPSASAPNTLRAASPRVSGSSPTSVENQARVVQYLVGELSALLGNVGDLEVDRLLMEINQASRLLPYIVAREQPEVEAMEDAHALGGENVELRRKLRLSSQKLKEQEKLLKNMEVRNDGNSDVTFELAACRSVSAVLQKQLTEEKNSKEKLLRENDQLTQSVLELQGEKKKLLQILANKEQEYFKSKKNWKQEAWRHDTEHKRQTGELEANQLSLEAVKKENRIMNFTLKQKDAEIERLKELARGLQQSLSRLLADLQQHQPNGVLPGQLSEQATVLEGLQQILSRDHQRRTHGTRVSPLSHEDEPGGASDVFSDWARERGLGSSRGKSPNAIHSAGRDSRPWKTHGAHSPKQQKMLRFAVDAGPNDRMSNEAFNLNGAMEPSDMGVELSSFEHGTSFDEVSTLSSRDEEEFKRDLATLDADIARIQRSLRETALKT